MGNTLIDEPLPPTQNEPAAGDRPTVDDVTLQRRGASPTLIDGPPQPAQRRGASPTLPDAPPHAIPTPPLAPLHAAPLAPAPVAPTPVAGPLFAAPAQPAAPPQAAAPQPAAPVPAVAPQAPTPPAGPVLAGAAAVPPSGPPGALPVPPAQPEAPVAAPPPLAYPKPGAGVGFLAQLPAMPAARAALPAAPVRAAEIAPPAEEDASRAAVPPPAPLPASPAQPPVAQGAPPQGSPAQAPAPVDPQAPRLPPGSRTLLGVAPGSPPQAGPYVPNAPPAPPPPQGAAPAGTPPFQDAQPPADAAPPDDAQAAAPAQQPPSKSRARTAVAAIFAVLGVLGIAAVVVGYFFFVRYTPLAARHIPAASNVAIRADVREIGTFEPVRKHVITALLDRPSASGGKTLADRVTEATGIHPAVDVREIIVASVDSKSWVALVGGNFKPGKFVPGLEKALHDDGRTDWRRAGDLLVGPTGVAVGQADDGTVVVGTESEIVTAALPSSEEYKRMDLPKDGALSFAVSKEAFEELSRDTGAFDPGGSLRRIRHLKGTLALGADPSVSLDLEPKGGENADALGKDVETFLGRLRLALVLVQDQMGEKTALSSAKVSVENGEVMIRGPWPMEGLDRGCQKLAALLGVK
jgi:hypothetical protein